MLLFFFSYSPFQLSFARGLLREINLIKTQNTPHVMCAVLFERWLMDPGKKVQWHIGIHPMSDHTAYAWRSEITVPGCMHFR